jgi:glycosyltransferase involved in cell wall biosynthesis
MTSSLPEVVGQAGTLVDPTDAEAMALAMQRVLTDADLREEMRAAGLERAQLFSWRRTAQDTADTYRRALSVGEGEENV